MQTEKQSKKKYKEKEKPKMLQRRKMKPYQIQSINVNEYLKCFSMRVYELVFCHALSL